MVTLFMITYGLLSDFNSTVHYSIKYTNSCGVMILNMKQWQGISYRNTTSQALLVEENSVLFYVSCCTIVNMY